MVMVQEQITKGKQMADKVSKYYSYVVDFCIKNQITLRLDRNESVDIGDGAKCAGVFDPDEVSLTVAMKKDPKDALATLIHEKCHAQQFLDNPKIFNTKGDKVFEWVDHQRELPQKKVLEYIKEVQYLEYDCECRAVEEIKKFKLNSVLNIKEYIQKANSYVNFYHYIGSERFWYKVGKEPYSVKEVWSKFPKDKIQIFEYTEEMKKIFDLLQ